MGPGRANFHLTLALTCAQAATGLLKDTGRWEVRSGGTGSKGERWYAGVWLGTASPRHCLLIAAAAGSAHAGWVPAVLIALAGLVIYCGAVLVSPTCVCPD